MFERYLAQGVLVQQRQRAGGPARSRQAIIEAQGQGAGFAVAGFVRMLASLVPGDHFQDPQRWRSTAVEDHLRRVERQFAPRRFLP